MIINDERFAAGLLATERDGTKRSAVFDDIGCMLEYERGHSDLTVTARYVHDLKTRQWLDAGSAVFVRSEALQTPMASGLAAVADRPAADELQKTYAGQVLDLAGIRDRRGGEEVKR